MTLTDLETIDPAGFGSDVEVTPGGSATSILLIVAICVSFAVLAAAATSIIVLTGNAWFGSAMGTMVVGFIFGALSL